MMKSNTSQRALAQIQIERAIEAGETDLQKIYTIVCGKLGLPRPTVRRAKKFLLEDLKEKVRILEPEVKEER